MANTKSAKKALRSSIRKRTFNLATKAKIATATRELRKSITTNLDKAQEALSKTFSALDKAVKTKFIKRGTADRKKSRLAKMLDKALNNKENS